MDSVLACESNPIKFAWTTAKFLSLKEVKEEMYYLTRKKKKKKKKTTTHTQARTRTIKLLTNHSKAQNNKGKFELFFFSVFINMGQPRPQVTFPWLV